MMEPERSCAPAPRRPKSLQVASDQRLRPGSVKLLGVEGYHRNCQGIGVSLPFKIAGFVFFGAGRDDRLKELHAASDRMA